MFSEVRDLNRARHYLRDLASNYSIPVYSSIEEGIQHIVQDKQEQEKKEKQRWERRNSHKLIHAQSLNTPTAKKYRQNLLTPNQNSPTQTTTFRRHSVMNGTPKRID